MTATLWKIIADFNTVLTLKVAVGATTATLETATDDDGVALPTGTYFLTIDGNSSSSKEYIKCTLTSTALTAIQNVSRQGTLTTGFAKAHRAKTATVTITDFAIIKKMLDLLDGTTTFNASVPLGYDGTATISTANQFATKAYVDGVAIAGGADASTTVKGITKMSVAPASAASPIAVGDNDPRVPTTDENDALAGTSGTPSSSNKYVTADDVAENTASKAVRRKSDSNVTVPATPTATTDAASKSYTDSLVAAITTTIPEQDIPYISNNATTTVTRFIWTTNTTGSVAFVMCNTTSNNVTIRRLARETASWQYVTTHENTFGGSSGVDGSCLAIAGSYVYLIYSDGGTKSMRRYSIADLTGITTMTISGTNWVAGGSAFSDDTNLYIYTATNQFHKYTISGTTATFDSTITYTSGDTANNGGAACDGTNVYIIGNKSTDVDIRKYALAGGAVVSTTSKKIQYTAFSGVSTSTVIPFIYNSAALGLAYGHVMCTDLTISGAAARLTVITKP